MVNSCLPQIMFTISKCITFLDWKTLTGIISLIACLLIIQSLKNNVGFVNIWLFIYLPTNINTLNSIVRLLLWFCLRGVIVLYCLSCIVFGLPLFLYQSMFFSFLLFICTAVKHSLHKINCYFKITPKDDNTRRVVSVLT